MSGTTDPLVTVAIPTFRRPDYLRLAIQCCVGQTYPNLEIIVYDDQSRDSTPDVVAAFRDSRIRYYENSEKLDLAQHFNLCLRRASGKYFLLLCDDDLISPEYVEALVRGFRERESATVGIGRCEVIDQAGVVKQRFPIPEQHCYPGFDFLSKWLWGKIPDPRPTWISMFMRTEAARAAGGFLETPVAAHADNALFIALALQGDVVFAKEGCFRYRVYTESYGLSVSPQVLARSSKMLVDFMNADALAKHAMARLTENQRRLLCDGVARIAARTYLYRISTIYQFQLSVRELVGAIFSTYDIDVAYLRAFPRFVLSMIKHRLLRLAAIGVVPSL